MMDTWTVVVSKKTFISYFIKNAEKVICTQCAGVQHVYDGETVLCFSSTAFWGSVLCFRK